MQPYRGRNNVTNLQTTNTGGCSKDLRAKHQHIDLYSLLHFDQPGQLGSGETGLQAGVFIQRRLWPRGFELA
jgi:hypothetical protein